MARRGSILIILFIIGLILFDAIQQQYYINSFELTPEPVLLSDLLKTQSINWSVWGLMGIPFGFFIWRLLRSVRLQIHHYTIILFGVLSSVFLCVVLMSLISIWRQNLDLTTAIFSEFFVFFSFQKGLSFSMAYGMITILLNNHFQATKVKVQEAEIVNLTRTSEELAKNLLTKDEEPFLSIKTGSKISPIALREIIWIQADDYCVRIHSENKSYTLRKSMKALEEQLKPYRFIRIHRGALLNLHYVDQINFESSTVRLQNERELPISRSGIKTLKNQIKESSL